MSKYRIQTVSQMTGLSAALIRAWEARYRLVVPQRSPAGYRLYSDEDVAILRGAQRLVTRGMAPMQVAQLDRTEILASAVTEPIPPEPELPGLPVSPVTYPVSGYAVPSAAPDRSVLEQRGPEPRSRAPYGDSAQRGGAAFNDGAQPRGAPYNDEPPAPRPEPTPSPYNPGLFVELVAQVVDAFAHFDGHRAEQILGPPLAILPPPIACEQVLLPVLREIGERWHCGALTVGAEHFGTNVIRAKLLGLLESQRPRPGARRIVLACPPGEQHELGLLLFTMQAVAQGFEPIYLGANLPLFDLVDVVGRTRPDLVALSFVQRRDVPSLCRLLGEALALLAGRARLLVGGRGVEGHRDVVQQMGCLVMPASGRIDDLFAPPEP